jgi:hypothetical protein
VEAEITQTINDRLQAFLADDIAEGDRLGQALPYLHQARAEWQDRITRNT